MTLEAFRAKRSREKHAAILDAALALFSRDGFAGTSMERVAAEAGVSTATLYRHFASKTALFESVASDALDVLDGALEPGEAARLDQLASAYAHLLTAPRTRAIVRMLVSETGRGGALAESFYASTKSRISEVFAAAVARETGRAGDDPELGHIAGQLQGMIEHSTLMRGLVLGDAIDAAGDPDWIARDALDTWRARWAPVP
ncbi:MAG: TetR/AcrR family transcriptional regulator [Pseudomonadota bacterium]